MNIIEPDFKLIWDEQNYVLYLLKSKKGHEILCEKVLWKTIYGEALIELLMRNEIEHPITEDKLPIIDYKVRTLAKNMSNYISTVNSNLSKNNIFNHK